MTYNILKGAKETLQLVVQVIKSESPDFLTLNEANGFADQKNKILKQFSKETRFPYFEIALSEEKADSNVAVFSKQPFIEVKKIQPQERPFLICLIDSPFGPISVAGVHLSYKTEDLRLAELEKLLYIQKSFLNSIIMGDINSLSSQDNYSLGFVKTFNEKQKNKFTKDGKLRLEAVDKILSAGYFDPAVTFGKNDELTVPTPANEDEAHSEMRLDYIFLSEALNLHLKKYEVIKNDLTDRASDHYPVIVEIK